MYIQYILHELSKIQNISVFIAESEATVFICQQKVNTHINTFNSVCNHRISNHAGTP